MGTVLNFKHRYYGLRKRNLGLKQSPEEVLNSTLSRGGDAVYASPVKGEPTSFTVAGSATPSFLNGLITASSNSHFFTMTPPPSRTQIADLSISINPVTNLPTNIQVIADAIIFLKNSFPLPNAQGKNSKSEEVRSLLIHLVAQYKQEFDKRYPPATNPNPQQFAADVAAFKSAVEALLPDGSNPAIPRVTIKTTAAEDTVRYCNELDKEAAKLTQTKLMPLSGNINEALAYTSQTAQLTQVSQDIKTIDDQLEELKKIHPASTPIAEAIEWIRTERTLQASRPDKDNLAVAQRVRQLQAEQTTLQDTNPADPKIAQLQQQIDAARLAHNQAIDEKIRKFGDSHKKRDTIDPKRLEAERALAHLDSQKIPAILDWVTKHEQHQQAGKPKEFDKNHAKAEAWLAQEGRLNTKKEVFEREKTALEETQKAFASARTNLENNQTAIDLINNPLSSNLQGIKKATKADLKAVKKHKAKAKEMLEELDEILNPIIAANDGSPQFPKITPEDFELSGEPLQSLKEFCGLINAINQELAGLHDIRERVSANATSKHAYEEKQLELLHNLDKHMKALAAVTEQAIIPNQILSRVLHKHKEQLKPLADLQALVEMQLHPKLRDWNVFKHKLKKISPWHNTKRDEILEHHKVSDADLKFPAKHFGSRVTFYEVVMPSQEEQMRGNRSMKLVKRHLDFTTDSGKPVVLTGEDWLKAVTSFNEEERKAGNSPAKLKEWSKLKSFFKGSNGVDVVSNDSAQNIRFIKHLQKYFNDNVKPLHEDVKPEETEKTEVTAKMS